MHPALHTLCNKTYWLVRAYLDECRDSQWFLQGCLRHLQSSLQSRAVGTGSGAGPEESSFRAIPCYITCYIVATATSPGPATLRLPFARAGCNFRAGTVEGRFACCACTAKLRLSSWGCESALCSALHCATCARVTEVPSTMFPIHTCVTTTPIEFLRDKVHAAPCAVQPQETISIVCQLLQALFGHQPILCPWLTTANSSNSFSLKTAHKPTRRSRVVHFGVPTPLIGGSPEELPNPQTPPQAFERPKAPRLPPRRRTRCARRCRRRGACERCRRRSCRRRRRRGPRVAVPWGASGGLLFGGGFGFPQKWC